MAEKYDLYMQVGKKTFEVDDDLTALEAQKRVVDIQNSFETVDNHENPSLGTNYVEGTNSYGTYVALMSQPKED